MIIILCLIILSLVSFISLLTIKILQQKKLILSYDNCLKLQGKMQRLMHLANLAKVRGHDMVIDYSTIHDYSYILFYKNGWNFDDTPEYTKVIYNDETSEEAIKDLERLIK